MPSAAAASQAAAIVRDGVWRPLDPPTQAEMAERLGEDFSGVRIHTSVAASKAAAAVGARAYTLGESVVFGAGAYAPDTAAGRRTLAHELVHVQQQRRGEVAGQDSGAGIAITEPGDRFERDAELRAEQALRDGQAASPRGGMPGSASAEARVAQRQPDTSSQGVPEQATAGLLAGAPPTILEDIEEESSGAVATIARQAQTTDAGGGTPRLAFECQTVSWSDYAPRDPDSPFDANTEFRWTQRGAQFSAHFEPRGSWVRPRIRNDTGAASLALLRHEQYHLRLVCLLAAKATAAVAAGSAVRTVVRQMRQAVTQYTAAYDHDTDHGRNAAMQDQWVADIDAGVVAFPP